MDSSRATDGSETIIGRERLSRLADAQSLSGVRGVRSGPVQQLPPDVWHASRTLAGYRDNCESVSEIGQVLVDDFERPRGQRLNCTHQFGASARRHPCAVLRGFTREGGDEVREAI